MMKEKMPHWPHKFVGYYSERFHSHYTSNGWKVGGKAPMKDFKAAFCSQWKHLKFKEDQDMLVALTPKPKSIDEDTLNYLNDALEEYRKDPKMEKIRLAACYDWLKEHKLIKISFAQRQEAIEESRKDLMSGKALAVTFVFDYMVNSLLTFNYFFNEVT